MKPEDLPSEKFMFTSTFVVMPILCILMVLGFSFMMWNPEKVFQSVVMDVILSCVMFLGWKISAISTIQDIERKREYLGE